MALKTINEIASASVKIQRSEFIAFLYPAQNPAEVKSILSNHNNQYKDATHNCYAYILGEKQENQYYSDQGEPSGTAGKPILNVLLKNNMTNVLAIVTRYYGGIKLGVRGLIDAYGEATANVISQSRLVIYISYVTLYIECMYNSFDSVNHALDDLQCVIKPLEYSDVIRIELLCPKAMQKNLDKLLDDYIQKGLVRRIV